MSEAQSLRVFISYAHRDEAIRKTLETHLAPLVREQIISLWHDRSIGPGMDWERELDRSIERADLILLLVSPDFINSDYCFGREMEFALAQHDKGLARVIPILIRNTYLERSRISKLQFLPRDGRSIADFENIDLAWKAIVSEIDKVARDWELQKNQGTFFSTENEAKTIPSSKEWNGFAIFLQAELRKIDAVEHWEDRRFTDLDAEVEAEERLSAKWIPSLFKNERRSLRRESSLIEAMENTNERLVLLEGEPGSGKSVGLRHLARALVDQAVSSENTDSVLPLYVNLKAFKPVLGEELDDKTVRSFILRSIEGSCDWSVRQFFQTYFEWGLNQGRWLLLLDSFDEIPEILSSGEPDEAVKRYAHAIHAFAYSLHSKGRVIVASRPYRGPKRMGWPRFRILPLGEAQRKELVERWFEDEHVVASILSELAEANNLLDDWIKNPLYLSLFCAYKQSEGVLPRSTYEAFEGLITRRLARDEGRLNSQGMTRQDIRNGAEQIAFSMTDSSELGLSPTRDSIRAALESAKLPCMGRAAAILDALEELQLGRGPTENKGERTFTFLHRRIQEYFATCFVLKNPRRIDSHRLLTDGRWRETTVTLLQTSKPPDLVPLLGEAEKLVGKWVADLKHQDTNLREYFEGRQCQLRTSPFPWPQGSLHLLGVLQSGLSSSTMNTPGTPLQNQIDVMLLAAYNLGIRIDKRFALEVAGAGSPKTLEALLTNGFLAGSTWIKDICYQQAARLREVPEVIGEGMRLSLEQQWLQNRLTSDRSITEAHLRRVDPGLGLLDCFRLLLNISRIDGVLLISTLLWPLLLVSATLFDLAPPTNSRLLIIVIVSIVLSVLIHFLTAQWPHWNYRLQEELGIFGFASRRAAAGEIDTPGFLSGLRVAVVFILSVFIITDFLIKEINVLKDTLWPLGAVALYWLVCLYWAVWAKAAMNAIRYGRFLKPKWWPLLPILFPIWRITSQVRISIVEIKSEYRKYVSFFGFSVALGVFLYLLILLDNVKIVGEWGVASILVATGAGFIVFQGFHHLLLMVRDQSRLVGIRKQQPAMSAMDLLEGCSNLCLAKSRLKLVRWARENNRVKATPEAEQILLDLISAIERDGRLCKQQFPLLVDESWRSPFKDWYQNNVKGIGLFNWYSDGLIDELSQLLIQVRAHFGIDVAQKHA